MAKDYSIFSKAQWIGHCGPTSLAYAVAMLNGDNDVSQRALAWAAGRPWSVFLNGIDEGEICRAARRAYRIKASLLRAEGREEGSVFLTRLSRHLRKKGPAVLSVEDGSHWVAVLGYLWKPAKFVVVDPADHDVIFSRWGKRTLLVKAFDHDDDNYLAVLLQHRDGAPPKWKLTDLIKYRG